MFVLGSSDNSNKYYVELSSTNQQHVYNITTKADAVSDVRVTLAYTDYFGSQFINFSFFIAQ